MSEQESISVAATATTTRKRNKTAREVAYSKIRKAIFRGKFPPGTELPEGHLADFCGVSRTPVRQALRMLADEGIVVCETNKRAIVADAVEAHTEEIFDMLAMLEGYSARLAARNISEDQLRELKVLQEQMDRTVREHEFGDREGDQKFLELNSKFHRGIHSASGNTTLYEMINKVVDYPQTIYLKFGKLTENKASVNQHADILDALERRDEEYAEIEMKRHVESIRREFRHFWTKC